MDLLNLLMVATELHPDLPIFPVEDSTPYVNGMSRSMFPVTSTYGLYSRLQVNLTEPINYIRKNPAIAKKAPTAKGRPIQSSSSGVYLNEDDSSSAASWPKAGKGIAFRLLPPEIAEDGNGLRHRGDDGQLADDDDYESFSVILFDDKGTKIEENGVKVPEEH